jgi:hypothetical protein
MPWAKVGPAAILPASVQRLALELVPAPAVVIAPALALLSAHGAPGIEQLRRAALADDARQHGARAHVAAGKPDAGEQERGLRLRRGKRRSEAMVMIAPAPTATPSTAEMIGLPQPIIALTRSPVMRVKFSRLLHVHFRQRADDVVHIAAGTEVAAVGQEYNRVHIVAHRPAPGTCRAAPRSCRRSAGSCGQAGSAGWWRCHRPATSESVSDRNSQIRS